MQIKGKSLYSSTVRPATKGEYPSNCYEVCITDIEIVKATNEEEKFLTEYLNEHLKDVEIKDKDGNVIEKVKALKIANSRYEIPMFDQNANRLPKAVPISNGVEITLELQKNHSDKFKTDYLVVKAIQVNEPIKEFNPFSR